MFKKQFYKTLNLIFSAFLIFFSYESNAREQIRIVGSVTLYPFITMVAEKYGKISGYTPIVEATGTGGGFKLFCSGNSLKFPDIVSASRLIKPSEEELCKKNSVTNFNKISIGYDSIVVAQSAQTKPINLTNELLFLALAKQVPINNKIVNNPYKRWSDINSELPDRKIEIYGPTFTSGTRDAFVELVMQKFCKDSDSVSSIIPDSKKQLAICSTLREDGHFIEMSENHNLLIQKLIENKDALSILSYSLLEDNSKITLLKINNVFPNKINITSGKYQLTRPLYLYVNYDHLSKLPSLENFIEYITSAEIIGEDGYLSQKNLITPFPK